MIVEPFRLSTISEGVGAGPLYENGFDITNVKVSLPIYSQPVASEETSEMV